MTFSEEIDFGGTFTVPLFIFGAKDFSRVEDTDFLVGGCASCKS